ncbi:hypothetical protein BCR44DRAFT_34494 [Catenaria anguillulae PL171]|uniref:Uncharacterized protein n=1 Tax=Catenaria anguillulae PL171 TaxID=765915 RepID=A0A1Y2I3A2_9FUNG|nr:hypothetical protein BCR44DRAFT_34494 [Catenaria anguillulae PL171]
MSSSHPMGPPARPPIRHRQQQQHDQPRTPAPHGLPLAAAAPAASATALISSSAHAPPKMPVKPAPGVDMSAQTTDALFFQVLRRATLSLQRIIFQHRRREQQEHDGPSPPTGPSIEVELSDLIGRKTIGRPFHVHGWESLIVPLLGFTLAIAVAFACIHPLWSKAYSLHMAARTRILQCQHTLAVTPPLVALLRARTRAPARLAPPARVFRALYQLCSAESPAGPACDAGVHHLIQSPSVFAVLDVASSLAKVVDAETARVEAEYASAKRIETELGVKNASSKAFHTVMLGLDASIVLAVRTIHAKVAQTVRLFDEFAERTVKDGVLSKLQADRERLEWQARQGIKDEKGVMRPMEEVIRELSAWQDELLEVTNWWARMQGWLTSTDEHGAMRWIPRHLWDQLMDLTQHEDMGKGAEAGLPERQVEL